MNNLLNFRDLGGIAASDGRRLRKNRLLRSAEPSGLSPAAIDLLTSYGLVHIIDFRRPWEAKIAPADQINGAAYTLLDVAGDKSSITANLSEWLAGISARTAQDEMFQNYKFYISLPSAIQAYSSFLKTCAQTPSGAILFHCHAGKDRTGVAAAILLKLLGASDEDIYLDYLETLKDLEPRMPTMLEERRAMGLSQDQIDALTIYYGVKREYLDTAFAAINTEHGSFDNYISQALNISAQEIQTLKDLYLE